MKAISALKLTEEGATTVLQGALKKARSLGLSASVAVVDDGGHLLVFARTDGAELYTVPIALAKGRSAALTRFPTGKKSPSGKERDDHHALAITLATGPGSFVSIPGGMPIFLKGQFVGAVGVSGAGEKDVDIAQSGVATLEE